MAAGSHVLDTFDTMLSDELESAVLKKSKTNERRRLSFGH